MGRSKIKLNTEYENSQYSIFNIQFHFRVYNLISTSQ